jgi:general secretion pathway protein G
MQLRLKSGTSIFVVVFGLIALVLLATPRETFRVTRREREGILRTDLRIMRDAIDNYTLDKQRPPESLQDLVDAGYLRTIPIDPMTGSPDWVPDIGDPILNHPVLGDAIADPVLKAEGLYNVHSNSGKVDLNGDAYNIW